MQWWRLRDEARHRIELADLERSVGRRTWQACQEDLSTESDTLDEEFVLEQSTSSSNPDLPPNAPAKSTEKSIELTSSSSFMSYIDVISSSIDKYSRRFFEATVLKYSEHYRLSIGQQNGRVKVILLCHCGRKMSIYRRDESSSYILSNSYAHLSQCTYSKTRQIL